MTTTFSLFGIETPKRRNLAQIENKLVAVVQSISNQFRSARTQVTLPTNTNSLMKNEWKDSAHQFVYPKCEEPVPCPILLNIEWGGGGTRLPSAASLDD